MGWLAHASSLAEFELFFKAVRDGAAIDVLKPWESQWLLQQRARLFADMKFADLRRCQFDIETGTAEIGGFSDARKPGSRTGTWKTLPRLSTTTTGSVAIDSSWPIASGSNRRISQLVATEVVCGDETA